MAGSYDAPVVGEGLFFWASLSESHKSPLPTNCIEEVVKSLEVDFLQRFQVHGHSRDASTSEMTGLARFMREVRVDREVGAFTLTRR